MPVAAALRKNDESEPRLYSRPNREPYDVIAEEHLEIHAYLDLWGMWNRERYRQGTCASVEKLHDKGGRDTPPASTAPQPVNPKVVAIENAVCRMPEKHRETIIQYYVKRWPVKTICWAHALQYEEFWRWMMVCRGLVLFELSRVVPE